MVAIYRCSGCRARFKPTRRHCYVCGTVGGVSDRTGCRDCGARLVAGAGIACPWCGDSDVEQVAVA